MSLKLLPALLASLVILGGCAQNPVAKHDVAPERQDPDFLVAKNARADELYVNPKSAAGAAAFRKVFIAPVNLSKIQIIQPEGVNPDGQWQVTDIEDGILQNALVSEFATALSFESAYNIVNSRGEADMVINTTIVAIHPNSTRAQVDAGAKSGGAITVSLALVNAATGNVMVRSVDTKSTDNIWAFNQVDNDSPAVNLIFRAWGNNMRRGLLHLQGRSSDPLAQTLELKEK